MDKFDRRHSMTIVGNTETEVSVLLNGSGVVENINHLVVDVFDYTNFSDLFKVVPKFLYFL